MNMQKKLEETYLPEQKNRKGQVIVGLSGGLNSYVTAYLLKIQKYDLIGVTVAPSFEGYQDDLSQVLSCHINQNEIQNIKDFCHQLGIPHILIKSVEDFKENVVENWVASRLTGTFPNQCHRCHELRMELLYQKMKEIDAQGIATGHIAKIFKQESHGTVYVHTANDEVHDQSALLSRLPHEILDKLILPLSDLQQKEINKLGENFGLSIEFKKLKMHHCFNTEVNLSPYLEEHVPAKYCNPIELINEESQLISNEIGIHHYTYGQVVNIPGQKADEVFRLSRFSMKERKAVLSKKEYFQRKRIFLNHCRISEETSWSEPIKGVLRIGEGEEGYVDCMIYPKNNFCAVIELESSREIYEGSIITILKKRGKNSKVYLTGKVRYIPETQVLGKEGEGGDRVQVDYSRDF